MTATRLLNLSHNTVRYRTVFRIAKSDSRASEFREGDSWASQIEGRLESAKWLRLRFWARLPLALCWRRQHTLFAEMKLSAKTERRTLGTNQR
jgi:hypothetical protein